jgi:hypothetical protein
VTLTTPPPSPALGSAEAVREASRLNYARPRVEIEAALRRQVERPQRQAAPVGRKPRRATR